MNRVCEYIVIDGVAYTEKPRSWLGGWAKQLAVARHFDKYRLVSPTRWNNLVSEYGADKVQTITI